MKKFVQYEYQKLKYMPDGTTSEFVWVGVVVFYPGNGTFKYYFTDDVSRVRGLFPCFPEWADSLEKALISIKKGFSSINTQGCHTVYDITKQVLPPNEGSIRFDDSRKAMHRSAEEAFDYQANSIEKHTKKF